jgi:hypothetical protein
MYATDVETFGVTLPTSIWAALIQLAMRADRLPSDYLRILIEREADKYPDTEPQAAPTPQLATEGRPI